MKENLQIAGLKSKTKKTLGDPEILRAEEYDGFTMETKVELIIQLIPLGLMRVNDLLQEEVASLAGERYMDSSIFTCYGRRSCRDMIDLEKFVNEMRPDFIEIR